MADRNNRAATSGKGTNGDRPQEAPVGPRFGPGPGGGGPGRGVGKPVVKAKNAKGTLVRLWQYVGRQRALLVAAVLAVALTTGLGLIGPYLQGRAIDGFISTKDLPGLARISLIMLGTYLAVSASTWVQTFIMIEVAQRTVYDLREELFAKLQLLSLRYFDRHSHGELMSRLTNDIENVSVVLSEGLAQFISSVLSVVGVVVMMLALSWQLALVSLISIPLLVVLTSFVAKRTRRGYQDQQKHLGELNSIIEETITGQQVVKAFGQEETAIATFDVTNELLCEAATRAQTYSGMMGPMGGLINNTSFAIIAGAGGWLALAGITTVGTIAAFISYARQFMRPLSQMSQLFNTLQSALAGAERVFEIFDEVPELPDAPDAPELVNPAGDVVFDHVSFGYDDDVSVLKDVSLHATPGQTIALVGPTGAGKTTIVNLLTRFYDIDQGQILIDGENIRDVQKASLRRSLGIVLQDTFLFADTVMENIRYGRLDATDQEVMAAAKLANADHFIRHLPEGYMTSLSERGGNLSQGQRQLIAIARVMLSDPSILILDEATSSVDTRTEAHIQAALLKLMEGRTSFVIAHRLSTIRGADNVLVINNGEIIERGNHHELLEQKGFYYGLYMSQFRGQAQVAA